MDQTSLKLIYGFVALILGLAFITQIATSGDQITSTTPVTNEVLDISGARLAGGGINQTYQLYIDNVATGWKVNGDAPNDCLPGYSGFVLKNQTGATMTGGGTDYTVANSGIVLLKNVVNLNRSTSNSTTVSYNYCADDYMNLGWGRTTINLIPGFFALALLMLAVGLFYSVAKDTGIVKR